MDAISCKVQQASSWQLQSRFIRYLQHLGSHLREQTTSALHRFTDLFILIETKRSTLVNCCEVSNVGFFIFVGNGINGESFCEIMESCLELDISFLFHIFKRHSGYCHGGGEL